MRVVHSAVSRIRQSAEKTANKQKMGFTFSSSRKLLKAADKIAVVAVVVLEMRLNKSDDMRWQNMEPQNGSFVVHLKV